MELCTVGLCVKTTGVVGPTLAATPGRRETDIGPDALQAGGRHAVWPDASGDVIKRLG